MTDPNRRAVLAGALAGGGLAATPGLAQNLVENPGNWATMTRAERNAAYDNTAAVPESASVVDRWNADSAKLRRAHRTTTDLSYGPRPRNRWDLLPASDSGAPCLVFIHGGYWQGLSRESFGCLMEGVRDAGMASALPGYTLAPDASLTEIVVEIRAAIDWLVREGPQHGIAGPILVSGWSAGGHLATLALNHPEVKAGLAISGLFELAPLRDTDVNDKLNLTDQEVATLSPMRIGVADKPLAIAYGTAELPQFVEHARVYHAFRAAQHRGGALIPVPRANHFTVLEALRAKDGPLAQAVVALAMGLKD